jgi:hypothetical protein
MTIWTTNRSRVMAGEDNIAGCLEQELNEERDCFVERHRQDWNEIAASDGPRTTGIDASPTNRPLSSVPHQIVSETTAIIGGGR